MGMLMRSLERKVLKTERRRRRRRQRRRGRGSRGAHRIYKPWVHCPSWLYVIMLRRAGLIGRNCWASLHLGRLHSLKIRLVVLLFTILSSEEGTRSRMSLLLATTERTPSD